MHLNKQLYNGHLDCCLIPLTSWLATIGDVMITVSLFTVSMTTVLRAYYISFLECRTRNTKRKMLEWSGEKKVKKHRKHSSATTWSQMCAADSWNSYVPLFPREAHFFHLNLGDITGNWIIKHVKFGHYSMTGAKYTSMTCSYNIYEHMEKSQKLEKHFIILYK